MVTTKKSIYMFQPRAHSLYIRLWHWDALLPPAAHWELLHHCLHAPVGQGQWAAVLLGAESHAVAVTPTLKQETPLSAFRAITIIVYYIWNKLIIVLDIGTAVKYFSEISWLTVAKTKLLRGTRPERKSIFFWAAPDSRNGYLKDTKTREEMAS